MSRQLLIEGNLLVLKQGDITLEETEAIVNAANSGLMGGGGVDGAIHRAGGPQILKECAEIVSTQGPCRPGQAVITSGGFLAAHYVIHTVGPIWYGGGRGEREILARAYLNSLKLAREHGIKSIAFPSISTGAYRFPVNLAAEIAILSIIDFLRINNFGEVRVVLFNKNDYSTYTRHLSLESGLGSC